MNYEQNYQCDFEVKKGWMLMSLEDIAKFKFEGDTDWTSAMRDYQQSLRIDPKQPMLQQYVSNNINKLLDSLNVYKKANKGD